MKKGKRVLTTISAVILILAMACLYIGAQRFFAIRPATVYEDKGVYTFSPYRVLPTQVKNTAGGRQGRLHPTKTVYYLYYRETGGTGYKWKEEVSSRGVGQKKISEGREVKRRVLSIKKEGKYITVEPEQTAKSYVAKQRRIYGITSICSIIVLLGYLGVWIRKRKKKAEM